MNKVLLVFMAFFMMSISSNAQEIKVKKGNILVDKVKIGSLEKGGSMLLRSYAVKDNNDSTVFVLKKDMANSLLYADDKTYVYYSVTFSDGRKIGIEDDKFVAKKDKVAKYLVDNKLLDENGVNQSSIDELISKSDTVKKSVNEILKQELQTLSNKDYIVARPSIDYPIYIEAEKMNPDNSVISGFSTKSYKYNIFQLRNDKNDVRDKVYIGYAYREYNDDGFGDKNYIIYNSKDVPLAKWSPPFRYVEYGPKKKKDKSVLESEKNAKTIVTIMATSLIKEHKL
ncbi:MAG: hypothetical protein ABFR62_14115 [Bacteroidota bacterium]